MSPPAATTQEQKKLYVRVWQKLILATGFALLWTAFSWWIAQPWVNDLARYVPYWLALLAVLGIAIIPGYCTAFVFASLAMDKRPVHREPARYPGISIIVAAYNEASNIQETLRSIAAQGYPGAWELILVDDGSTDGTADLAQATQIAELRVIRLPKNRGKANALNEALTQTTHEIIISVDADTLLYRHALRNIVARYLADPPGTFAVAGSVMVRNSRKNFLTRIQEWDYFHGIAVVKRVQSLYQGTLVAQGAFSLYHKAALKQVGGWPDTVGEDIVMTWAMLKRQWRIGYAENAIVFTNVPENFKQFYRQRRRWARGLIEALRAHPQVLWRARLNLPFFLLNLLYPFLDFMFLFCLVPGLIAALFGYYHLAGPITLAVLPLAVLNNSLMLMLQRRVFDQQALKVRRNTGGFLFYVICAQFIMCIPSLAGYFSEFIRAPRSWGTK